MKIKTSKSTFVQLSKENNDLNIVSVDMELPPLDKYGVLVQVKACGLDELPNYGRSLTELLTRNLGISRVGAGSGVAGVVVATGEEVTSLVEGDHVVGMMPLDSDQSGCSDYVVMQECDVCLKPTSVSFVDAAGCLDDAVKAYIALHYLARLTPGQTVLVLDGATSYGSLCIQTALAWRIKVLTTCVTAEDRLYLVGGLGLEAAQVIQLDSMRSAVMLETGQLGVDAVVDQGVSQFKACSSASKHDVIGCLAVGARWVTTTPDLQLDPPHTAQLMLRGASVCFMFHQVWLLSGGQQGKYQHMLKDIMDKLANKTIHPNVHRTVNFGGVSEAVASTNQTRVGRLVMTNVP